MVIAKVLHENDQDLSEIDDVFLARRIKHLARVGRIDSRGDLDRIRRLAGSEDGGGSD